MDLISSVARRSRLGEIGHVVLNIGYAVLLLVLILLFSAPWLSFLLVVLSKWRVLAVRPRFWLTNLKANALDALLGIAVVTLMWQNIGSFFIQVGFCAGYALWLIFLKPSAKRRAVLVQAAIAQFVTLWALFTVAYAFPLFVVVLLGGFIGFVVAHHAINVFAEEYEDVLLSLIWAFILSVLCWLAWYWTVAYTALRIPEVSIVTALLGFLTYVVYEDLYLEENSRTHERRSLRTPILFALAGIALLLVSNFFDQTSL